MSEPTRYEYSNGNNYWGHFINPKTQHFAPYGEYVRYEDYARLEHELKYWKIEAETDHARWLRTLEENARLKAEVERLRKAGDDLAGMVGYHVPYEDQIELEKAWNAAKECKV